MLPFLYNMCAEYISARKDSLLYSFVVFAVSTAVNFFNYKIISNWVEVWNDKYSPLPNRFVFIYVCKWALDVLRHGTKALTSNWFVIVLVLLRISIIICNRITSKGTVFRTVNILSHFVNIAYLSMILLTIVLQYYDYLTGSTKMEKSDARSMMFLRMNITEFCHLSLSFGKIPLLYLEKRLTDKIRDASEKLSKVENKFYKSFVDLSKYEIAMYVKYLDKIETDHVWNHLKIVIFYFPLTFCILSYLMYLSEKSNDGVLIFSCLVIVMIAQIILFGEHMYKIRWFSDEESNVIKRQKVLEFYIKDYEVQQILHSCNIESKGCSDYK